MSNGITVIKIGIVNGKVVKLTEIFYSLNISAAAIKETETINIIA